MSILLLLTLLGLAPSLVMGRRFDPIGPGFWNAKAPFYLDKVINIGCQMSLIQLENKKFVVLDTVELTADLKAEFDQLTNNGTLVDGFVATHPFHTTYFPAWYAAYPNASFYGTPRHLRNQPQIPWAGNMFDCASRQRWLPEIHMRIPAGAEFVHPEPESSNHFTGIHVFHTASKTVHVDDTINIDSIIMVFHPSMLTSALYHTPGTPSAFRDWVRNYTREWDFVNMVSAHRGNALGHAKFRVEALVVETYPVFEALELQFYLNPNSTQADRWQWMQQHEAQCVE